MNTTFLFLLWTACTLGSDLEDTAASVADDKAVLALDRPVKVRSLVGQQLVLPRSGRTVVVESGISESPGGSNCTVDLAEIEPLIEADLIAQGAIDADPAEREYTIRLPLKYRGGGICWSEGNTCNVTFNVSWWWE
jgi:hypothetical protein